MPLPLKPGDKGPMVTQMQNALVKNGFFIGESGANGDFNDDTLRGLNTFQDDNALTVQPLCDETCWKALGLSPP